MSKIEGLFRLAASQSADELVLKEDQPPALRVSGALRKLSMPVMDGALVREMLAEAVGESASKPDGDERVTLSSGSVRVRWRSGDRFEVIVSRARGEATKTATATATTHVHTPEPTPAARFERAPIVATTTSTSSASVDLGAVSSRLARLCATAFEGGASDLVLAEGRTVSTKLHGEMVRGEDAIEEGELLAMLGPWIDAQHRATFDRTGSADFAVSIDRGHGKPMRFRCGLFRALAGVSAVLRPIRDRAPTLRELRLPDDLSRYVELHDGLVILTGAAGSGKSTTLVALVEHLARNHPRHVVTLEDPIEYVFDEGRAVIHQREIGAHVESFAAGLRAALRESPDVILLGEMRDPETIAAAVTAAETGHLVLSTLHAGSAAGAIERMIDAFPEHSQRNARGQIADVLRIVITQRLVPSRDGGRAPALEILPVNAAVASLVREGKAFQIPGVLQTGREAGMVPMARSLAELVRTGVVSRDVAMTHAPDPQHLLAQLGR